MEDKTSSSLLTPGTYPQIDVLKFLLSLCVVGIHTIDPKGHFIKLMFDVSVPVFFVISGYMMYDKIVDDGDRYINKRLRKILRLYIIWSCVYFPLTVYGGYLSVCEGREIGKVVLDVVRRYLLVGENYCSYILWYILAMVVGLLMIKIFRKFSHFNTITVWGGVAVVCVVLIGQLLDYYGDSSISMMYRKIFLTTRNGLFEGFPLLYLGMSARKCFKEKVCDVRFSIIITCLASLLLGVVSIFLGPIWGRLSLYMMSAFIVTTFFLMPVKYTYNTYFVFLRKLSTWIFFTHLIILFALNKYGVLTGIDKFMYTSIITIILGVVIIYLFPNTKILKYLLGN